MGCHQADAAEQAARRTTGERPPCPERIFWVLRSGAPWRDLPECFGSYTTCYNRFVRWRRAGVWGKIMNALAGSHDAAVQMLTPPSSACISTVPALLGTEHSRWAGEEAG
jgi:transposase